MSLVGPRLAAMPNKQQVHFARFYVRFYARTTELAEAKGASEHRDELLAGLSARLTQPIALQVRQDRFARVASPRPSLWQGDRGQCGDQPDSPTEPPDQPE
jgi:hypothetical protein